MSDLSELKEVVKLTTTLDDSARRVGVEPTASGGFIVNLHVQPERATTITAAVMAFDSVEEAAEVDPS